MKIKFLRHTHEFDGTNWVFRKEIPTTDPDDNFSIHLLDRETPMSLDGIYEKILEYNTLYAPESFSTHINDILQGLATRIIDGTVKVILEKEIHDHTSECSICNQLKLGDLIHMKKRYYGGIFLVGYLKNDGRHRYFYSAKVDGTLAKKQNGNRVRMQICKGDDIPKIRFIKHIDGMTEETFTS